MKSPVKGFDNDVTSHPASRRLRSRALGVRRKLFLSEQAAAQGPLRKRGDAGVRERYPERLGAQGHLSPAQLKLLAPLPARGAGPSSLERKESRSPRRAHARQRGSLFVSRGGSLLLSDIAADDSGKGDRLYIPMTALRNCHAAISVEHRSHEDWAWDGCCDQYRGLGTGGDGRRWVRFQGPDCRRVVW